MSRKSPASKALTRIPRANCRPAPRNTSPRSRLSSMPSARSLALRTRLRKSRASPRRCWCGSAKTASRRWRTLPAARPTTSPAGPSAKTAKPCASPAFSMDSNFRVRKPRPSSCRRGSKRAGSPRPISRRRRWKRPRPPRRSRKRKPDSGMAAQPNDSELDNGPRARELERLCVVTRTVRPVSDLIRFVVGPAGEAVADIKRKLPGRGVWVTATQDALADAVKRKVFARGFKRDVRTPADLVERTDGLLERAALEALAMAGKAGLVAAGFAKAEAALQHDEVAALMHAAEGSPDG